MLYTNLPAGVEQKRANVYGSVELDYLEAGPKDGPVIILLHGFPEGAWSWRHQLVPLAEAGWHVVAPDQLGYSGSTAPKSSDAYSSDKLSFHALGLVDHVSGKPGSKAVVVGHDWGSILLSDLARTHPERVLAAIAVSVPLFAPPEPPIEMFRQANGDRYFYIVAFQNLGKEESILERDPKLALRRILYSASAAYDNPLGLATDLPAHGTTIIDTFNEPPDGKLPGPWCSEHDLETYTRAYKESGFYGPVSWYRNFDANWHRLQQYPPSRLTIPVFFIGGKKDPVIKNTLDFIDAAHEAVPGYKGKVLIDNSGHWTQQETPDEFNKALLGFVGGLDCAPKKGSAKGSKL